VGAVALAGVSGRELGGLPATLPDAAVAPAFFAVFFLS
jgi:hypothetical protein